MQSGGDHVFSTCDSSVGPSPQQAHLVLGFVPIAPLALAIRAAPPILTVVLGCDSLHIAPEISFDLGTFSFCY